MNEEFIGETRANIKTLFKKTDEIESKIIKLEDGHKELMKISTILEMQQQLNKEQSKTLFYINENLIHLNETVKNLGDEVSNLNNRVEKLEDTGKFDIKEFNKELFYKVLPSVLGGLLLGYLGLKFGLKL